MVKEVIVAFRMNPEELKPLDALAQKYRTSRSEVLRAMVKIFAKNVAMQNELEEVVKRRV